MSTRCWRSSSPTTQLPVEVRLQAFTPLVPLDVDASGIPGAVLRYTVRNPLDRPVDVTVAGSMSSPIGIVDHNVFQMPVFEGRPRVAERRSERPAPAWSSAPICPAITCTSAPPP